MYHPSLLKVILASTPTLMSIAGIVRQDDGVAIAMS